MLATKGIFSERKALSEVVKALMGYWKAARRELMNSFDKNSEFMGKGAGHFLQLSQSSANSRTKPFMHCENI